MVQTFCFSLSLHEETGCLMLCSAGGLILARNLGHQNMKKYHIWNLFNQDINSKVLLNTWTNTLSLSDYYAVMVSVSRV